MKKYHLFVCNTYMQLITAMQIRLMLFAADDADLILSDHSVNAETIADNLKKTGIFKRVGYARSKSYMVRPNNWRKIEDTYFRLCGNGRKIKDGLWNNAAYDHIFQFNYCDLISLLYFDESVRQGVVPHMNCFDEGLQSYKLMTQHLLGRRYRLIKWLRKLLKKEDPYVAPTDFYCYYPELFPAYGGSCHLIPHLSRKNNKFITFINTAFEYHPDQDAYSQKYIYFASSADIDGKNIGETELIFKIADLVGRKNLLVKMHPRDERHVYEEYGITVSRNSAIPWEVIQMNHDFSSHVFLSISSGSVLSASAMLGDNIETYYLYPLVRGKNLIFDSFCEKQIAQTVDGLKKLGALQRVYIADNLGILKQA